MIRYINENTWINLSSMPIDSRGRIDWNHSIGHEADFMYNTIRGRIKILEKIRDGRFKVNLYVGNDIIEYQFVSYSIKNCNFGMALKKPIAITNPEFIIYFANKEDAYKYTVGSSHKIDAICPFCGLKKKIDIRTLTTQGLACPQCTDGVSYSNKLMFNILSQLHLDFQSEINKFRDGFEWVEGYKYDFYFEQDGNKYFIEMDGGFHYGNGFLSYEEAKQTDEKKDILAKEHNIIMIRINCNYRGMSKRFEFIKQNILNSTLSNILDLSSVSWETANKIALESKIKSAANLWNTTEYCTAEIAKQIGLAVNTVRKYLRLAASIGLCNYNTSDAIYRSYCANHTTKCITSSNITIQN